MEHRKAAQTAVKKVVPLVSETVDSRVGRMVAPKADRMGLRLVDWKDDYLVGQ